MTVVNQSDSVVYEQKGFDGDKYIELQKQKIYERISKFPGRLYLEIGGKFLADAHASRVLPGFYVDTKKRIFSDLLQHDADIVFCVNARDLVSNRQLSNQAIPYETAVCSLLHDIVKELGIRPFVAINMVDGSNTGVVDLFVKARQDEGFVVCKRYVIAGYPQNLDSVIGEGGYGKDDYIPVTKKLVLVTGAASNSGKMSTCLGQVYHETLQGSVSGYAKYETFPIWNLPLDHPINIAYEAATADIYDYNCIDSHHELAYHVKVVNYNRDVAAFPLVRSLLHKVIAPDNFMRSYQSPTDMGINMAGFCLLDEEVIKQACVQEVHRRKSWYEEMVQRGDGEQERVDACERLLQKIV